MEDIINTIRAAVAPDATVEAKTAGIAACRAVLGALDARAGASMAAAVPASPVAAMVGALRGMPPDQLLDLAIAKLRASLPADVEVPAARPISIPIIGLPGGPK